MNKLMITIELEKDISRESIQAIYLLPYNITREKFLSKVIFLHRIRNAELAKLEESISRLSNS